MHALLSTARRVLLAPALVPLTLACAGLSWLAVLLARQALGGDQGFLDEVRAACLPFAGALVLSLAEPLEVGREAREGWLRLRAARGGGFAQTVRHQLQHVVGGAHHHGDHDQRQREGAAPTRKMPDLCDVNRINKQTDHD
jgi:hypothetical protein